MPPTPGRSTGDPTQIYLFVRWEPAGGGIGHYWELLTQAWAVADQVLGTITALQLARAVRKRLAGGKVVEQRARDWLQRHGGVDYVARTLCGDPWRPRDFAGVFGCTTTEAESVLAVFGYSADPTSDSWVFVAGNPASGLKSSDASAEIVVRYSHEVLWRYTDEQAAPPAELEALVQAILERASTDGDLPSSGIGGI